MSLPGLFLKHVGSVSLIFDLLTRGVAVLLLLVDSCLITATLNHLRNSALRFGEIQLLSPVSLGSDQNSSSQASFVIRMRTPDLCGTNGKWAGYKGNQVLHGVAISVGPSGTGNELCRWQCRQWSQGQGPGMGKGQ